MFSGDGAAENSIKAAKTQAWDYRWHQVPKSCKSLLILFRLFTKQTKFSVLSAGTPIEGDTSIMTYRGHVVVKTLVRCRFSPAETTGQRYIYTGCGIGRVISKLKKVKKNLIIVLMHVVFCYSLRFIDW